MRDYGILRMTTTTLQRKLYLANLPILSAERHLSSSDWVSTVKNPADLPWHKRKGLTDTKLMGRWRIEHVLFNSFAIVLKKEKGGLNVRVTNPIIVCETGHLW